MNPPEPATTRPRRRRARAALVTIGLIVGAQAPLAQAAPSASGAYQSLAPSRILDTRTGLGASGPVRQGAPVMLQVTGRGGVPASGVASVVLNLTATNVTSGGYVTAYPAGAPQPNASNLNTSPGGTTPNLVTVAVGTDGQVALANMSEGTADLVADVAGYYLAGTPGLPGTFVSLSPARVLDTRAGNGWDGAIGANQSVDVSLAGRGGLPASDVAAVVLNLTVTEPQSDGFLTASPTDTTVPNASNVNFAAGQTIANLATVRVSASGAIRVTNTSSGSVHVIADVAGYYRAGTPAAEGAFVALPPTRILDTRTGNGAMGAVAPSGTLPLQVAGRGGVPSDAAAVVMNTTVTQPGDAGFLTAYPFGTSRPTASNLNFAGDQTVPNLVNVMLGQGRVNLTNTSSASTQVIADVAGYLRGTSDSTATSPLVDYPRPTPTAGIGELSALLAPAHTLRSGGSFGGERLAVVDAAGAPASRVVEVRYPAGSASQVVANVESSPRGGAQGYFPRAAGPLDEAYLRYSVFFPAGFNFVKGGKLPGLYGGTMTSGGQIPNGTNGLSTRYMWRAGGAGEVYAYLPTSVTNGTSLGRGSWTFPTGRWTCLVQHVRLNTPGRADGSIAVSQDGVPVLNQQGLTFRTVDTLKIDGLFFSTFFGGGDPSWATPTDQVARFAHIEMSANPLSC